MDGTVDIPIRRAAEILYHVVGLLLAVIRRPLDLVDLDESTPFTEYLKLKGNVQPVLPVALIGASVLVPTLKIGGAS